MNPGVESPIPLVFINFIGLATVSLNLITLVLNSYLI